MQVTVIHGQAHKGSGYHIAESVLQNLTDDTSVIHEFFLPRDADQFCIGCYSCIMKGCEYCPHKEQIQPIVAAIEKSDVMIIDSPTYCMEMSGALKSFFDHVAYLWLSHRPSAHMFNKVGIVISTAAGGGARGVTKSMGRQLFWLGVPVTYKLSFSVKAARWDDVPDNIKSRITRDVHTISGKVQRRVGRAKPNLKMKFLFHIMRKMQQFNDWNVVDQDHWRQQGWLAKSRPWHGTKQRTY